MENFKSRYKIQAGFCLQCRLIVAQMSNTRCEILPWILLPVAAAAVLSFILPNIDLESMYFISAISLAAHIHYGTCVVSKVFSSIFSKWYIYLEYS